MKTFIAALLIFALLCTLVLLSSGYVEKQAGALLSLAFSLPGSKEKFRSAQSLEAETDALCALWVRSMRVFPYIISYDMLEETEEAVASLSAAAESGCEEDFLSSRLRLICAVARIKRLFALSPEGIA